MRKSYQYRLYPTKAQLRVLEVTLEECRWVYNETLALRKTTYETTKKSLSLYETHNQLPGWKEARPALQKIHSQVLQNSQLRVDLAFKAFFRRVQAGDEEPGFPRFKGKGRYDSITYPQAGYALLKDSVKLSKIGTVKAVIHRPIEGAVKTCTIRRTSTGKWFACFSCELPDPQAAVGTPVASVGIDLGISSFATLSNGIKIDNPKVFKTYAKRLAKASRRRELKPKGSPERNKARLIESKIHEKMANARKDFAHKTSRLLVNHYDFVALEKLDTKEMLGSGTRTLSRCIADAAWSQFVNFTQYKAASAGIRVVLVDPKNTTKECSRCGVLIPKDLSERVHRCTCGLVMGRDENAAVNILRRGLASLGINHPRSPRL